MKLHVRPMRYWNTNSMHDDLTIRGLLNDKKIWPQNSLGNHTHTMASIIGSSNVSPYATTGQTGTNGPTGDTGRRYRYENYIHPVYSSLIFELDSCYINFSSDTEMHIRLEHSDHLESDLAIIGNSVDFNVYLEYPHNLKKYAHSHSLEWYKPLNSGSFFDFTVLDNKSDLSSPCAEPAPEPVPKLSDTEIGNLTAVFNNVTIKSEHHRQVEDVFIAPGDVFRDMLLEDAEKYVVQLLHPFMKNISMHEERAIASFDSTPFEYWTCMFDIFHMKYLRDIIKKHYSNKYRSLSAVMQHMEKIYVDSISHVP